MAIIPTQRNSALPVTELPPLGLISNMGMALKGSSEVNNWCQINYNQDLHVFSGSDPENPPGQDKYPLIELFPLTSNGGREIEEYESIIGLAIGIYDESKEDMVYQDFEMQQGLVRLEELYSLILATIAATDLYGGYISEINAQRNEEVLHPYFVIGAAITIIKPI